MLCKAVQEDLVLQFIRKVRERDRGIGGLKLWYMYRREFGDNHPVGRDRFGDIVNKYGLKVRMKKRRPRTTDSTHGLPVYPNLIKEYIPTTANRLWVSDITYITIRLSKTEYAFCYLSLILDAYTEEIVGWSVGPTLETRYSLEALKMALGRIGGGSRPNLIHHSDRGCQYASSEYVTMLKRNGIRISMTENGNPKENPQAERINNTIKNEMLKGVVFRDIREVVDEMPAVVDFYNNERPHMSLNMMTPAEAASYSGELQKKWTSYRLIAIKKRRQGAEIAENGLPLPSSQGSPSGLQPPVNP